MNTRSGSDYSQLDEHGLIKEGTIVTENTALLERAITTYPVGEMAINIPHQLVMNQNFPKKDKRVWWTVFYYR